MSAKNQQEVHYRSTPPHYAQKTLILEKKQKHPRFARLTACQGRQGGGTSDQPGFPCRDRREVNLQVTTRRGYSPVLKPEKQGILASPQRDHLNNQHHAFGRTSSKKGGWYVSRGVAKARLLLSVHPWCVHTCPPP